MEPIPFQHEQEHVLYRSRRSVVALMRALLRGLLQGMVGGVVLGTILGFAAEAVFEEGAMVSAVGSGMILLILLLFRQYQSWRATTLTVTSQRILVHGYDLLIGEGRMMKRHRSLFHALTHTVRWDTYQESIYEGGVFSHVCNLGTLTIRHGTAEATRSVVIDLLPYAQDLKHYLDKLSSLRGVGTPDANMPTFVRARRGKRDKAVLSYVWMKGKNVLTLLFSTLY